MKISIITVCKNAGNSIEKTICSVLEQTYQDIEYIIIDGASTDNTLQIINKYSGKISKIISEPDSGLYDAMNKGIDLCTGEFIYFLNAGDILIHENVIDNVVKKLKNAKEEIIYGNILLLDKKTGKAAYIKQDKVNKQLFYKETLTHPSVFTRKTAFNKIGVYNTEYKIVSDYEWFLRAFVSDLSFKHIDVAISIFFSGGVSTNPKYTLSHYEERFKVIDKYFNKLEKIKFCCFSILRKVI